MTTELRIRNPITGGEKGKKRARFDLIPPHALIQVAEHYGKGAEKYEDRNWERGYEWSLSFAAMQRHAWAFWTGEDYDPETATHHLAAVVFHAFALMTFGVTHPELDDRTIFAIDSDMEEWEWEEQYLRFLDARERGDTYEDALEWDEWVDIGEAGA